MLSEVIQTQEDTRRVIPLTENAQDRRTQRQTVASEGARGWAWGRGAGTLFDGDRVSVWEDKKGQRAVRDAPYCEGT